MPVLVCQHCSNPYRCDPGIADKSKYCSRGCYHSASIGRTSHLRHQVDLVCQHCGQSYQRDPCTAGKSYYCSASCRSKSVAARQPGGDGAYRWKNGIGIYQAIGRLSHGRLCQQCGGTGREVHHIDKDRTNNAPGNLRVLCVSCHRRTHRPRRIQLCERCHKSFSAHHLQHFCSWTCRYPPHD